MVQAPWLQPAVWASCRLGHTPGGHQGGQQGKESLKAGVAVKLHLETNAVHPRVFLTLNTNVGICLMGSLVCVQVLLTFKGQQLGLLEVESKWAPNKVWE